MKRIIYTMAFLCSFCIIQAQDIMKVKKVDGSIVEYNVSDIDEVFFERVETNPNNPNGKVGTAIDLGLSCLWASWNVGASSEKESGGLYGWADGNGTNVQLI